MTPGFKLKKTRFVAWCFQCGKKVYSQKTRTPIMIQTKKLKTKASVIFCRQKMSKRQMQATFDNSTNNQLLDSTSLLSISPVTNIFFNTCFDKNHLKKVIAWFLEYYGEKKTVDLVETLKQVGFHQATRAGVSLGIDDLQIPPEKGLLISQSLAKKAEVTQAFEAGNLTSVEKSQRLIDTWNQTSETLRQAAVHNFRTTNPVNPVYMMAFSGARGNISQVRQLVAMRGLMADPQGAILEFPIQSNFREGLTVTEYLLSCYGARKGLVDTALRTATSGYLTRRLVDAVQHVVIHVKNCETTKGIVIKKENVEQRLLGRVLLNAVVLDSNTVIPKDTLVSRRLAKQIAATNQPIFVRSPLTCQTEKSVCQLCYGIDLAQGQLVSLGEAVGIIAAQSIGEPGTQLTMRTFHTGGVGVFSDQAMKSFIAPFHGKIDFLGPLPGLFVRTPHGNIVYLLKHQPGDKQKTLLRLISSQPMQKPTIYEIKHGDVPSGSLLWVKQGELVKTGQLLLQGSRLESSRQEMPESNHPVRTPFSGELFFDFMRIRVIEEIKRGGKKKKQQEISPTIPFLIQLGLFWVFSCFVQKQAHIANSFFLKGDLLSPETPLDQYNLQVARKGQLKKLGSSVVFAQNSLEVLCSKIHYSERFYFLREKENLFTYTTTSTSTVFTWYPFFKKKDFPCSGYCLTSQCDTDFGLVKSLELSEKAAKKTESQTSTLVERTLNYHSYLWSTYQVFSSNRLDSCLGLKKFTTHRFVSPKLSLRERCYFLVTGDDLTFSRKGVFQLKQEQGCTWSQKKKVQVNFRRNCTFFAPLAFPRSHVFGFGIKNKYKLRSFFIEKALKNTQNTLTIKAPKKLIEKKQGWFCVLQKSLPESVPSQLTGIVLEPGKKIENLCFQHSSVSVHLLHRDDVFLVKAKTKRPRPEFVYSVKDVLLLRKRFPYAGNLKNTFNFSAKTSPKHLSFHREFSSEFCFYKKQSERIKKKLNNFERNDMAFEIREKRRLLHFLFIEKMAYYLLPERKFFYDTWLLQKKSSLDFSVTSPLCTKQFKTTGIFTKDETQKIRFEIGGPPPSGWVSMTSFFKVDLEVQTPKLFRKFDEFQRKTFLNIKQKPGTQSSLKSHPYLKKKAPQAPILVLSVVLYRQVTLEKAHTYDFQSFFGGWVLPDFTVTRAFVKSKTVGEFRRIQVKNKNHLVSFVRAEDTVTLAFPNRETLSLVSGSGGSCVRWGQELLPGFASPLSGQIIKITPTGITLRKALPLVASLRGLLHVTHGDLIQKDHILMTLRSKRLETEDIVQGIPKIEQLFEARETQGGEIIKNNMHTRLSFFYSLAKKVRPLSEAIELSLTYIQRFLVKTILEAYSNQGVHIAEKHVEVVVRQMTARVRITYGGDTGFLPGEILQLRMLEQINLKLATQGRREAGYEPIILGITKSVLQSESFLLAASFQQVSKILVRSALAKKTDFLRGLHENVLVGQPIPAGTGVIYLTESRKQKSESMDAEKSLSSLPKKYFLGKGSEPLQQEQDSSE